MGCEPVEQIQILPSGNLIVCYGNMTHIPTILNLVTLDSYVELPRDTYLYLMDLSTTYYSVKQFGQLVKRAGSLTNVISKNGPEILFCTCMYIYMDDLEVLGRTPDL